VLRPIKTRPTTYIYQIVLLLRDLLSIINPKVSNRANPKTLDGYSNSFQSNMVSTIKPLSSSLPPTFSPPRSSCQEPHPSRRPWSSPLPPQDWRRRAACPPPHRQPWACSLPHGRSARPTPPRCRSRGHSPPRTHIARYWPRASFSMMLAAGMLPSTHRPPALPPSPRRPFATPLVQH
jgi:hypothetical protein